MTGTKGHFGSWFFGGRRAAIGLATFAPAIALSGVAGCKSEKAESRPASECLGYTTPPGWTPPARGNPLVFFGHKTTPMGTGAIRDNFLVRVIPAMDMSLDQYKDFVIKMMTDTNQLKSTMKLAARASQDVAKHEQLINATTEIKPPRVEAHTVSGRAAYRIATETIMQVGGKPLRLITRSILAKFGNEFVIASAGFPDAREPELTPLAEAFLASFNFDKCK